MSMERGNEAVALSMAAGRARFPWTTHQLVSGTTSVPRGVAEPITVLFCGSDRFALKSVVAVGSMVGMVLALRAVWGQREEC